ncbi:MAG: hypothetical protein JO168_19475 [Solirubrobacterales bacterium]|nr:hypothetical protein [Solirubrobacterales bacterium]MBV9717504.1 hypothetical protein [Solirubrobacterales bacterium]
MNPDNPWQMYATVCALAALLGGGCGAGAALVYAQRRVEEVEATVDSLEHRVTRLEQEVQTAPSAPPPPRSADPTPGE